MTVKHKTLPPGIDRPGFAGITPSLYAEEHAFTGGAQGSVLVRDTLTSDGSIFVATAAGMLLSTGVATLPSFTSTFPFTVNTQHLFPSTTNTYDLGSTSFLFRTLYARTSVVLGQTTANYTLTWANPASARAISFEDPGGTDIIVYKAATQTLTNKTLTAPVFSGTITGTYTLGGTPSISASALTGSHNLPDGVLSTNVPLLNATNTFTNNNNFSPTIAAGAYSVQVLGAAGADRDILIAAATGLSNGFQVQRVSGAMKYQLADGAIIMNGSGSLTTLMLSAADGVASIGWKNGSGTQKWASYMPAGTAISFRDIVNSSDVFTITPGASSASGVTVIGGTTFSTPNGSFATLYKNGAGTTNWASYMPFGADMSFRDVVNGKDLLTLVQNTGINLGGDVNIKTTGGTLLASILSNILTVALSDGSSGIQIYGGTISSQSPSLTLQQVAAGTGNKGAFVAINRNSSGGGAPGYLEIRDKTGSGVQIWPDSTGVLRLGGAPAEGISDTGGTVVGAQTSTRAAKRIYGAFTDNAEALREIVTTPLWKFAYKSGAYNRQRFVGITTDDSPVFGMDKGRSFNPVTAFGYTVAAIKALARELEQLKKANARRGAGARGRDRPAGRPSAASDVRRPTR